MGREAGAQGGSACGLQAKWAVERQESAWDWSTVPPRSGTRAAGSVRTLRSRPFPARQPILVQSPPQGPEPGGPLPRPPSLLPLPFAWQEGWCCCVVLRAACCALRAAVPVAVSVLCAVRVSGRVCVCVCEGRACCLLLLLPAGWLARAFFFFYCIPPPVASPSPPSPFPFSPS